MIYVACPANAVTGGPTLAHQMCRALLDAGFESRMFYYGNSRTVEEWVGIEGSPYAKYHVPVAESMEEIDRPENAVILPEVGISLRHSIKNAGVHIWWMSVDGYLYSLMNGADDLRNDVPFFQSREVLHFVQSRYAYEFLNRDMQIPDDRITFLTDYIDEAYLQPCDIPANERENTVFYNYTKRGTELPVIMEHHPEINWFPIKGMTMDEVIGAFHKGKIYVDFGNHPGKDRLPREAAACGLCILTNRNGSAANDEDVPIADEYKFINPLAEEERVISTIQSCFDEYDARTADFNHYREWIRGEKDRFLDEVRQVAQIIEESVR